MSSSIKSFPEVPANALRCVMIGDIVGKPGLRIAELAAPWLRRRLKAGFLVANGENAADGTGLRLSEFERLCRAGYDVITLGDHVYKKKEIVKALSESPRLVRPLNFPPSSSGKGWTTVAAQDGTDVTVVSLMGRVFMRPVDCPFAAIDRLLASGTTTTAIRLIDFHAEATSDKQSMGRYLDGRVSAVLGTHTHVSTADETVLPNGTGYLTDVGMTGPFESILGRDINAVIQATIHFEPVAFHVATGDARITGCWLDVDKTSGKCIHIERFQWPAALLEQWQSVDHELAKNL